MAGNVTELPRVENDALPNINYQIDVKLTTSFDHINLDVRLSTGVLLTKLYVIDDDDNGQFHFEFAQGDIPEGVHYADLVFFDLATPTLSFTSPEIDPIRIVARSRA